MAEAYTTGSETMGTTYHWLVGPGDYLHVDYETPTRVKRWLRAIPITVTQEDKQKVYGQWVAQLLQCKLGLELLPLYGSDDQGQLPITLRSDVIEEFDSYFAAHST